MKYFKKVGLFFLILIICWLGLLNLKSLGGRLKIEHGVSFLNKVLKIEKEPMEKNIKNKEIEDEPVKILFAGDLMLDRYSKTISQKNGIEHFTKDINDIFIGQDLNVLNLEGPVTSNQSISLDTEVDNPAHFKFTFDKNITKEFLRYNKINLVNLGNNHILNFGENGAQETVDFLIENKVEYFGSPLDDKNSYIEKEINGLKIALVSYNRFYKLSLENTVNKIKEAKRKNDIVIVYAHWGSEYKLIQSENQQNIAHSFIDNGADLIIGSHPHVVQPIELYKNKVIFYSLGNFVFDQFFSQDVKNELLVQVSFSSGELGFILTPILRNQDGSLKLNGENNASELLKRLAKDSIVPEALREEIILGNFKIKN